MRLPDAATGMASPDGADPLADFLRRAAARLNPRPPEPGDPLSNPRGDHSLDPTGAAVAPDLPHREAAVLVPILPAEAGSGHGLRVLLTRRAAHLRDHSGQVAFPGGKIDAGDATPVETALREAEEEIGLQRSAVRPLGYLDPYLSATAFLVTPVVGLVEPGASLRLNPDEVAETFEVPLSFLMDPARHHIRSRAWQGRTRFFYAIPFGERLIWGVTAGIVHNLYERLYP